MKYPVRIFSAALLSGLLATSSIVPQAVAQSAALLKPQTGWAVSKVASRGGSAAYCTLARRFNNSMILTIARNAKNESSLALDFQKDIFDTGKRYTIAMSSAGLSRAYEVRPVSGKAFVIRTGTDEEFYESLQSSGRMDVNIDGRIYAVEVGDLRDGETRLATCIAGITEPAAGTAAPVRSASAPAPKTQATRMASAPVDDTEKRAMAGRISRQSRELDNLSADVQSLREENLRLKNSLERERKEFEGRFMEQSEKSNTIVALRDKVSDLESENSSLRTDLAEIKPRLAVNAQTGQTLEKLEREVESLRMTNKVLQEKLDETLGKAAASKQFETQVLSLQQENKRLRDDLDNVRTAAEADTSREEALTQELAALQGDNERLRGELQALQEDATTGNTELGRQLAALQRENNRLREELEKERLAASSGKAEKTAELASLRKENSRLREELESERLSEASGLAEAGQRLAELQDDNEKLRKALEEALAAGNDGVDSAALTAQIGSLQDELASLTTENTDLKRRISDMEMATAAASGTELDEQKQAVAALTSRVKQLEVENGSLKDSLKSAQLSPVSYGGDIQSRSQLKVLEARLSSAEEQKAALSRELEALRKVKEDGLMALASKNWNLEEATRRYNEAEREIQRLGLALEKSQARCLEEKVKLENMLFDPAIADHEQIARLMELEKRLAQTHAALDLKKSEYEGKIAALEEEKSQLHASVTMQENKQLEISSAISGFKADIATLQDEKADLVKELAAAQQSLARSEEIRQQLASLKAEKSKLEDKLALAEATPKIDESSYEEVTALRQKLSIAEEEYRVELASLQSQLEEANARASVVEDAEEVLALAEALNPDFGDYDEPVYEETYDAPAAEVVHYAEEIDRVSEFEAGRQVASIEPAAYGASAATYRVESDSLPATEFDSAQDIQRILGEAGISVVGSVSRIESVSGPDFVAWRWDTGQVYGSAEQQAMKAGSFQEFVDAYIEKTELRCDGDFASAPGFEDHSGSAQVASYEIACIRDDDGAAAALLFYAEDGLFTSVAHETGMESMDIAMDNRDRLFSTIASTRTASR